MSSRAKCLRYQAHTNIPDKRLRNKFLGSFSLDRQKGVAETLPCMTQDRAQNLSVDLNREIKIYPMCLC